MYMYSRSMIICKTSKCITPLHFFSIHISSIILTNAYLYTKWNTYWIFFWPGMISYIIVFWKANLRPWTKKKDIVKINWDQLLRSNIAMTLTLITGVIDRWLTISQDSSRCLFDKLDWLWISSGTWQMNPVVVYVLSWFGLEKKIKLPWNNYKQ